MIASQSTPSISTSHTSTLIVRIWGIALCVVILLLALVNLPFSPRTWFDEGSHLHVPKTIVQYGVYADISSEGFRYYGPTVGVGPTVMLPIAAVFKLFGVELLYARLVITAYLLVGLTAFFLIGRRLHGTLVALLAVTLLLATRVRNYDGMLEYGRQVLGEVPGLAFLFLGVLAWLVALGVQQPGAQAEGFGKHHTLFCWLAGLGFGLAVITKNQFVLIIPPALALLAVLDWFYYKVGSWRLRIIPLAVVCACFGLWTLAQFQFLGPGSFIENMRQTQQAAGGAIFVFNQQATLRAGFYVLRPDLYGGLLVAGIGYSIWRARQRTTRGLAEALIVLIVVLWLTWFVGASLGWPRYAFPAVAFGALGVARLLVDLISWLWRRNGWQHYAALVVACYAAIAIAVPLLQTTRAVLTPDDSAQRVAAFLKANIPEDAIVETWEPELGVLTNHRYHYPPIALLDVAVRHEWLNGPPLVYDGLAEKPQYVVVGPFGQYTGIYDESDQIDQYRELAQIGPYHIYERK